MQNDSLDFIPLWLLFMAVCVFIGISLEGGYRFGKRRNAGTEVEKPAPTGAMVGSLLALLAFMLAFTFSLAATRFDARRQALVEQANAIETTYLRAGLLAEPPRSEIRKLLHEYVVLDIRTVQEKRSAEVATRMKVLRELLWAEATTAAEQTPGVITSVFIQSLNQIFEMQARRIHVGIRSRVPISIWVGLFILAVIGMTAVGYHAGLSETQRSPVMFALMFAFSGVMFLIANLDRGHDGILNVSPQALIDVQESMNVGKP